MLLSLPNLQQRLALDADVRVYEGRARGSFEMDLIDKDLSADRLLAVQLLRDSGVEYSAMDKNDSELQVRQRNFARGFTIEINDSGRLKIQGYSARYDHLAYNLADFARNYLAACKERIPV